MPASINTSHPEHSLDLHGCPEHETHVRARKHARAAWLCAGGPEDGFGLWFEYVAQTVNFDNLKALLGLAWQRGAESGGRPMVDAEFHAWWDSISGQNTLAAHCPSVVAKVE